MSGGEIFVPMIPPCTHSRSAPRRWRRTFRSCGIGIRPGENLHEIMCPTDDSHLTLRFHDHFVI